MVQDSTEGIGGPPLTENVIESVREINNYMLRIGADVTKISMIGTLSIWVSGVKYTYTPIRQDMELLRIQKGWLPLCAQKGDEDGKVEMSSVS